MPSDFNNDCDQKPLEKGTIYSHFIYQDTRGKGRFS